MSDNNFFTEFNDRFGFDESLLQTGKSNTENGYLQNEEALEFFKKKQADWNKISMGITSLMPLGLVGLMGLFLVALVGGIGTLLTFEFSISIDRIVPIMELLLEEFKDEGITITPRVKTNTGIIDLIVRTIDGRYFALLLRSNGDSKILWREKSQHFYTVRKIGKPKWSGLELSGERLNAMMLSLKEEKNPLVAISNAERKKGFTKVVVLTSKTRVDPNNDPDHLISFGRTTALRIVGKSTYYLVDSENLANFIRQPIKK
jgi:hypothetical protein